MPFILLAARCEIGARFRRPILLGGPAVSLGFPLRLPPSPSWTLVFLLLQDSFLIPRVLYLEAGVPVRSQLASASEIRDFRADAAVRQGHVKPYVTGLTSG